MRLGLGLTPGWAKRRRAPVVVPWAPTDIPGLATWFEGRDEAAILTPATQPVIVNGDFTAGTTGWTPNDSTLSVLAGAAPSGGNALRVTATAPTFWAVQATGIVGNRERMLGWARGDGAAAPVVFDGANLWVGTASTSWQEIDTDFTRSGGNLFLGSTAGSGVVDFAPFDSTNLSRTEWHPSGGALGGNLLQATAANQPWWDAASGGVRFGLLGAENRQFTFSTPIAHAATQTIYFAVNKNLATSSFRALLTRSGGASPPQPYLSVPGVSKAGIFVDGAARALIDAPVGKQIIRYQHTPTKVSLQNGNSTESVYVTTPTLSTWVALSSISNQGMEATMLEMVIYDSAPSAAEDAQMKAYLAAKHGITL